MTIRAEDKITVKERQTMETHRDERHPLDRIAAERAASEQQTIDAECGIDKPRLYEVGRRDYGASPSWGVFVARSPGFDAELVRGGFVSPVAADEFATKLITARRAAGHDGPGNGAILTRVDPARW